MAKRSTLKLTRTIGRAELADAAIIILSGDAPEVDGLARFAQRLGPLCKPDTLIVRVSGGEDLAVMSDERLAEIGLRRIAEVSK